MNRPVRIGNCSGFYGDRFRAAREMLDGPELDELTGDYLAELTMLILWRPAREPENPRLRHHLPEPTRRRLGICLERGVTHRRQRRRPEPRTAWRPRSTGCAPPPRRVAYLTGDDLAPAIKDLQAEGHEFTNLDTGVPLAKAELPVVTANAYLGGWGIAGGAEAARTSSSAAGSPTRAW